MKLTKYQKDAIVRAIMDDVPKPDKAKRREHLQAEVVKLMSPTVRKVWRESPGALARHYVGDPVYDGTWGGSREITIGDVDLKHIDALLDVYRREDDKRYEAYTNLKAAINGCSTLAQLKKLLPEFDKYFPTEAQPTKNLPALANVVADLSKLGWPKGESK